MVAPIQSEQQEVARTSAESVSQDHQAVFQLTASIKTSPSFGALACSLAKAQGEFGKVLKDITAKIQTKNGGSYSYQYADLASVLEAIRKPLSDNGLAIMQPTSCNGDKVSITTILSHSSGEWISSSLVLPVEPNSDKQPYIQAVGSAVTYGKRYALCGLLGISAESDDDGANTGPRGRQDRPGQQNQRQQPEQQTRTASSEDLNRKYNNPNMANAPAAKSQQETKPVEKPAQPEDPAKNLKTTLFRHYACTKKEDCDDLLRAVCANDEKGLDYFAVEHPDECEELLKMLEFYVGEMKCEKRHLLTEIRKQAEAAAAI